MKSSAWSDKHNEMKRLPMTSRFDAVNMQGAIIIFYEFPMMLMAIACRNINASKYKKY